MSLYSPPTTEVMPTSSFTGMYSPELNVGNEKNLSNKDLYKRNFKVVYNDIHKGRLDWFHLITGEEGSGKTKTAVRDCVTIDEKFLKQSNDLPQVPFSVKQFKEFLEVWRTENFYQRRGVSVLFDEANALLSSRRTLSKQNVELVNLFTQIRAEFGFFVVLNFQSFRMPESYVRNDRSKSLCRTSFYFNKSVGIHLPAPARYYNRKQIKQIRKDAKTGSIEFPPVPSFSYAVDLSLDQPIYDKINEKKYEFYLENEKDKTGKSMNQRRKEKLLLDYQVAKIDGDVEKQARVKKMIEEL